MRVAFVRYVSIFALLLLCGSISTAQLTCDRAKQLHEYALRQLGTCENPSTQNTKLCTLIGQYEDQSGGNPDGDTIQTDQLQLISNPSASGLSPWQNYLTQSAMTQFGDLGEISYILNEVNATYSNLDDNVTNDEYYAAWQEPWWDYAAKNADAAGDASLDPLSAAQTYFKAANYYFTGFWPFAFSDMSREAAQEAVTAFRKGAEIYPGWTTLNFTTPFNNGTTTADLRGIFITPDSSTSLPLVIITGGTDYPKEVNVLQFGYPALQRGYALLVYDGPGQGEVIRNPPYMPFYPQWEQVLSKILDYVEDNFSGYVDMENIVQEGVSLGGYLGTRACAGNSDRLVACVISPPIASVVPTYDMVSEGLAQGIYGGLAYAGQQDPSLLPSGYASAYQNGTDIIQTLFLTCNASSGAPQLIAESIASPGPVDPEIVYLAGGYGAAVSGEKSVLAAATWEAYRRVQTFGNYSTIGNISVPYIGFKGTQDDLLGGQEEDVFAKLSPSTANESTLITFDGASGGALHCAVGSPYLQAARQFGALNSIVSFNRLPSNVTSTTASAGR